MGYLSVADKYYTRLVDGFWLLQSVLTTEEPMHRIRRKKKPKRKIRLKPRSPPRRATGRRVRIRGHKRGTVAPMSSGTLRTEPNKRRRIVVVHKRRRSAAGRSAAKRPARSRREINVFATEGYQPVPNPSPRQAKLSSLHLIAVNRFLRTGDTEPLKQFKNRRIAGIELLTDPKRLREFADADLVKLDGLYRDQRGHGRRK
jgi:hypothetical protein